MTKPLITLPCTAQELEDALRVVCDHGLWDAKVYAKWDERLILEIETETKGESK